MDRTSGFAEVNGTRLWFETMGQGPPLVLIHGSPLDARMWDPQLDAFAVRRRVIRFDVRGYGRSAAPGDGPYRHEDDLAALLRWLGIDRAAILGLSMGGRLAVDFALARPDAVSSLVLAGSSLSGFPWTEDLGALATEISASLQGGDIAAARQVTLGRHWFQPVRQREVVRPLLETMIDAYPGWHWVHDDPVIAPQPPAFARLEAVTAPTLTLVGEYDHADIHQVSAALAARIPDARQLVFPGVGHMVNMEDPEAFNLAVIAFLTELPGDGEPAGDGTNGAAR